jgi:L-aminopeptidase/D-esterase-like protein
MTGTAWVDESGFLEGPIIITNTHSVGVARDAVIAWRVNHGAADTTGYWWSLPVVAETWDGWLNDINGFHVKREEVWHALDSAHGGALEEGSVGGGTGMICYEFKGGNGTASRKVEIRPERCRQKRFTAKFYRRRVSTGKFRSAPTTHDRWRPGRQRNSRRCL